MTVTKTVGRNTHVILEATTFWYLHGYDLRWHRLTTPIDATPLEHGGWSPSMEASSLPALLSAALHAYDPLQQHNKRFPRPDDPRFRRETASGSRYHPPRTSWKETELDRVNRVF